MNIKTVKTKAEKIEFVLEDTTIGFANALRRIMINNVPTMAVAYIDFQQNSSALFDEIISHRVGMIPLTYPVGKFDLVPPGTEDVSSKNQVVFALEKTGPCIVTSGDLKSSNKDVQPTSPDFPIVELLKGHSLKFEAVAHLGLGKDHARYQAAIAAYDYSPAPKEGPVKTEPTAFRFRVESVCGLGPEQVVTEAAKIMEERTTELKQAAVKM
ncbi:MAG: DNA-directed RNA polymerase subunit D [Nanoarchaeota archaeon]|nr:DNA-directed RNA polymerase subunit D [Nanoarchaeota archaeon]